MEQLIRCTNGHNDSHKTFQRGIAVLQLHCVINRIEVPMSKREQLIAAITAAADDIESGADYEWGHVGR